MTDDRLSRYTIPGQRQNGFRISIYSQFAWCSGFDYVRSMSSHDLQILPPPPPTPIERILSPFGRFARTESAGGVVLIVSTLAALVAANSGWAGAYHALWETHLTLRIGGAALDYSLHHWINDGLMAVFFFVVGLEIKREIHGGELSELRRAALPLFAALGGMLAPAAIYFSLNVGTPAARGWGVPMATDIAFAVGVLALLGKRVPPALLSRVTAPGTAQSLDEAERSTDS